MMDYPDLDIFHLGSAILFFLYGSLVFGQRFGFGRTYHKIVGFSPFLDIFQLDSAILFFLYGMARFLVINDMKSIILISLVLGQRFGFGRTYYTTRGFSLFLGIPPPDIPRLQMPCLRDDKKTDFSPLHMGMPPPDVPRAFIFPGLGIRQNTS